MKIIICLITSILISFSAYSQWYATASDTLQVDWEQLYGPPGKINCLTGQGDTIFVGTDYGIFYTFDSGELWEKAASFKSFPVIGIERNGSNVFALVKHLKSQPFTNQTRYYSIYHSLNLGKSFEQIVRQSMWSGQSIEGFINGSEAGVYYYTTPHRIQSGVINYMKKIEDSTPKGTSLDPRKGSSLLGAAGKYMLAVYDDSIAFSVDNFDTFQMKEIPRLYSNLAPPIGISNSDSTIYLGFFDNKLYRTSDVGNTWENDSLYFPRLTSDPSFVNSNLIDFWIKDTSFFFQIEQSDEVFLLKSNNHSFNDFENITPKDFYTDINEISFFDSTIVFTDSRNAVFLSEDLGNSWDLKFQGLFNGVNAVESFGDEIWMGEFKFADDRWELLSLDARENFPAPRFSTYFGIQNNHPEQTFQGQNKLIRTDRFGQVEVSYDDGLHWKTTSKRFQDQSYIASAFYENGLLMLNSGADGFFISKDDGRTWGTIDSIPADFLFAYSGLFSGFAFKIQTGIDYEIHDDFFYMSTEGEGTFRTNYTDLYCQLSPKNATVIDTVVQLGAIVFDFPVLNDTSIYVLKDEIIGCDSFNYFNIIVDPATSNVNDQLASSSIILSPNPGADVLNIRISEGDKRIEKIRIFDISGKELNISESNKNAQRLQISTSHLRKGIYFVEIRLGEEIRIVRWVKI